MENAPLNLILLLINLDPGVSPEIMREVLLQTGLGQSPLSRAVVGKPPSLILRDDGFKVYYFSEQDRQLDLALTKDLHELYAPDCSMPYFGPGSEEFANAMEVIRKYLFELRNFVEKAIKEKQLDMDFLNRCARYAQKSGRIMFRTNNWAPILEIVNEKNPGAIKTFQDDVEQRAILLPLFQGKGEEWSKIKICNQCRKFFFPQRSSAQFCSAPCRMRFNTKKNILTAEN